MTTTVSTYEERRKALQAELKELEVQELAAMHARRAAVKRQLRITIEPHQDKARWHKIYDPSVVLYRVASVTVNREECEAAGRKCDDGGMVYYYNKATQRIICSTGGGMVFISEDAFWNKESPDATATFEKLNAFLAAHPEGGDVTDIIYSQKGFAKKWGCED